MNKKTLCTSDSSYTKEKEGSEDMNAAEILKKQLGIELRKKDRQGVYGLTQRLLAYNSNKLEGGRLSEDQTAELFETQTLTTSGEIVRAKDIEEMTGHFAMFNYAVQTLGKPLSQSMIKEYHKYLKSGVFEDMANGYPVGEYKSRRNIVGRITTALPEEVPEKMQKLLDWYNNKEDKTMEDLARFHIAFETIHPFQDGNGRVGRMILYRQGLDNDMIPPLVYDDDRAEYCQALRESKPDGDVSALAKFFEKEQKQYAKEITGFLMTSIDVKNIEKQEATTNKEYE